VGLSISSCTYFEISLGVTCTLNPEPKYFTSVMNVAIFLLQCGEVKEVRLVKAKDGRPKGYAYIEYTDKVRTGDYL